jgi:hypothetical protein
MPKLRPLSISRLSNQNADAVIDAAERLGSDGRGRNGLRGYVLFLARDYPVQFISWLGKMIRAQLSDRGARNGKGALTAEREIAIIEALFDAIERLGSNGKGRGGAVGYFESIALKRPSQFAKLLSLVIDIQESELHSPQNTCEEMEPSLTDEEIQSMTLEEKKAKLDEILAAARARA